MGETHGLATATDGVETRALDTGRMIGGRYQVVRELGRGGMGVVYLVRDTFERDRTLALKSVRATDPGSQNVTSLKREFLVLAALRHPGLTPVHDFGCDAQAGELFFASEFVDGVDLSGATQSFDLLSPQGLKEFLGVIVQVLRGLAFVHAHGLIHGDLKPQNILVTGLARGEVPEAKLIDFGITAWEHQFSGKRVLGTKPYIAPEAIVGSHLDRRADLYSLGAMLYHLVVGEPPFGARSSVGVLKDHLETTPDLPTTRRPEVHAGFDDVISRLLRKNPSERYQNALEVVEAINRVFDENFRVETMETGCSYLRCTTATERATELRAMHQVFRAACKIHVVPGDESVYAAYLGGSDDADSIRVESVPLPEARTILLRGEKGSGKSGLIERFKHLAQTSGGTFLSVSCEETLPSGSEEIRQLDFDNLLHKLTRLFGHGGGVGADEAETVLAAAGDVADRRSKGELAAGESEVLAALARRLVCESQERPLVLHVSQVEQAGPLVQGFLSKVVECILEDGALESRFLLLLSLRLRLSSRRVPVLNLLTPEDKNALATEIVLRRLDREGVQQFLDKRLPGNDFADVVVQKVFRGSDGNVQALEEVCEFLFREHRIQRTASGWIFVGDCEELSLPSSVRKNLEEQIGSLPRQTLNLAVAFAFLGNSAELSLAACLARLPEDQAAAAIEDLLRLGVLEKETSATPFGSIAARRRSKAVYSFVHSTAQEIIYERVTPDKRKNLHNLAGLLCLRYYGADDPTILKQLAHQFLRAENAKEGIPYGIRSAELLAEEMQLRRSLHVYQQILDLCPPEDTSTPWGVHYAMARIHFRLGNFEEAARTLSGLSALEAPTDGAFGPLDVFLDLARVYARLGLALMAESWFKKAEAEPVPHKAVAAGHEAKIEACRADISFLQGKFKECLESCQRILGGDGAADDPRLQARCHLLAADSAFAMDDPELSGTHCRSALNLVDGGATPDLVDLSLYCLAKKYKYSGRFEQALRQFRVCVSSRRHLELADDRGEALVEMGAIELFLERPRRALRLLERSTKAYHKTKNVAGIVKTLNLTAECQRQLGNFDEATRTLEDAQSRQRLLGNRQRSQWESSLVEGRMCLDRGRLREAAEHLRGVSNEPPQDPRSRLKIFELRCQFEYQRGDFFKVLESSQSGLEAAHRLQNEVRSAALLEHRALAFHRLGQFPKARRTAETISGVARKFKLPIKEGRALLLDGMCLVADGKWEDAEKRLQQAEEVFTAQESERDLAFLYLHYGNYNLKVAEFERCFVQLEESLYLAKKLNLSYLKPQIFVALGLFECKIPDGDPVKAENYLRHAEKLCLDSLYADLHWQASYHLGCVLRRRGGPGAQTAFEQARAGRARVLQRIPRELQGGFLNVSVGADLKLARPAGGQGGAGDGPPGAAINE